MLGVDILFSRSNIRDMELEQWVHEFPEVFAQRHGDSEEEWYQQSYVYVVSETGRAPYKIGYVKYKLLTRMLEYRTLARRMFVHLLIGVSKAKYEGFQDRGRAAENFMHRELKDFRMNFDAYIGGRIVKEGGNASELFDKGITLTDIYDAADRMKDPDYPTSKYPRRFRDRLHTQFAYRFKKNRIVPFRGFETYHKRESKGKARSSGHMTLRHQDDLVQSLEGDVELWHGDNNRAWSVGKSR
jgi:hypothetical protein